MATDKLLEALAILKSYFADNMPPERKPQVIFHGAEPISDEIDTVRQTPAFQKVSGRKVEDIAPCSKCAIRHFCGSPCPAEAHEMNGGMEKTGAFCEFYEE